MTRLAMEDIPQKEDLELILRLPQMVKSGHEDSKSIVDEIRQVPRHANFLLHAGRVLGILRRRGSRHELTHKGRLFLMMDNDDARHYLRSLVERTKVMKHLSSVARKDHSGILDKAIIARVFERDAGLARTTAVRRASALCAWLKWLSRFQTVRMPRSGVFKIL